MKSLKHLLFCTLCAFFVYNTTVAQTQTQTTQPAKISANNLFKGLKNKTLSFFYNQELIIIGVVKEIGSSIIYNSSYILISDTANGSIYVKAVLADKNKKSEYKPGETIVIRCRFYEERDAVIVVKDAKKL